MKYQIKVHCIVYLFGHVNLWRVLKQKHNKGKHVFLIYIVSANIAFLIAHLCKQHFIDI